MNLIRDFFLTLIRRNQKIAEPEVFPSLQTISGNIKFGYEMERNRKRPVLKRLSKENKNKCIIIEAKQRTNQLTVIEEIA